jgi:hypothetical protein
MKKMESKNQKQIERLIINTISLSLEEFDGDHEHEDHCYTQFSDNIKHLSEIIVTDDVPHAKKLSSVLKKYELDYESKLIEKSISFVSNDKKDILSRISAAFDKKENEISLEKENLFVAKEITDAKISNSRTLKR